MCACVCIPAAYAYASASCTIHARVRMYVCTYVCTHACGHVCMAAFPWSSFGRLDLWTVGTRLLLLVKGPCSSVKHKHALNPNPLALRGSTHGGVRVHVGTNKIQCQLRAADKRMSQTGFCNLETVSKIDMILPLRGPTCGSSGRLVIASITRKPARPR